MKNPHYVRGDPPASSPKSRDTADYGAGGIHVKRARTDDKKKQCTARISYNTFYNHLRLSRKGRSRVERRDFRCHNVATNRSGGKFCYVHEPKAKRCLHEGCRQIINRYATNPDYCWAHDPQRLAELRANYSDEEWSRVWPKRKAQIASRKRCRERWEKKHSEMGVVE
jgi:hypothetical protein